VLAKLRSMGRRSRNPALTGIRRQLCHEFIKDFEGFDDCVRCLYVSFQTIKSVIYNWGGGYSGT
jgi:hypothetical protein